MARIQQPHTPKRTARIAAVVLTVLISASSPITADAQAPIDLTQLGTTVARIAAPGGGGNKNIEIIRDGDKPPVGSISSARSYDTYLGSAVNRVDDWIGYVFIQDYTFTGVVFQEGREFADGGWFSSLTVQVRVNGVWTTVSGFASSPPYPNAADGQSFESYNLTFTALTGDGIRIYGDPGGTSNFISVGELEVFGTPPGPAVPVECGDANGDGTITAPDGLRILKNAVDPAAFCPPNRCDIDGIGGVTATDAFLALEASVGLPVSMQCPNVTGVVFAVDSGESLGALQLEVDFSSMPGDLVGNGANVSCQSLVNTATVVFNRSGKTLRMSFASTSGFTGPLQIAYCDLTQPTLVTAPAFSITVVDAVSITGFAAAPFVSANLF